MMVQAKYGDDPTVFGPPSDLGKLLGKVKPRVDRLPLELYQDRETVPFSVGWVPGRARRRIDGPDIDIVNLHWICEGFLSVEAIGRIGKPVVWSLHDMWPFSGGCHYDLGCGRFARSCGACPLLKSRRDWDLSRCIWRRKARAFSGIDLTVVALSRWLGKCAAGSSVLRNKRIEVIPNGLDTRRFKPVDTAAARQILSLPLGPRLLLSGGLGNERIKGADLLSGALERLDESWWDDKGILVFGSAGLPKEAPQRNAYHLGFLHDDPSLVLAYGAADVLVIPSRQDNLPNTVMEAMACGTPCVAFDIGGMPDMIDHLRNGYLAEPFQVEDLAHGINWVLANEERLRVLSRNARKKAVQEFDQEIQARRYLALYEDILSGK